MVVAQANMESQLVERRHMGPRFDSNLFGVLEALEDLACVCVNGRITGINTAGQQLIGDGNVVGQEFARFVAADYVDVVCELLMLRAHEAAPVPVLLVLADGITVSARLTVHPARELGPATVVIIARDTSHESHLAIAARSTDERFRSLVDNSMHLICRCAGDRILYVNAAGLGMLGATCADEVVGMRISELFHGVYRSVAEADLDALLSESGIVPLRMARLDGTPIDAQVAFAVLSETQPAEFMVEARDIGAHNRAVAALRRFNESLEHKVVERTAELAEQKRFVATLLEAVPNPVWWKDKEGHFLGYNQAFRAIHGDIVEGWVGQAAQDVLPDLYRSSAELSDTRALGSGELHRYDGKIRAINGEEREMIICKSVYQDGLGGAAGIIGVMLDITERKHMEEELRRLALTDPLTGVYNRRHFMACSNEAVEKGVRYGRPLSVLMLDIDHFKRINDTYGHPTGDEAIKALTRVCMAELRDVDILGRLGGEEFAVLLPETPIEQAIVVAERLRLAISGIRLSTTEGVVSFTVSLGLAALSPAEKNHQILLALADQALYRAKTGGRNRVELSQSGHAA